MDFDALRRRPDVEAPELKAWDAADTLILDEAPALAGPVVVVHDSYGALTLGALSRGAERVRVHQDPLTGELALVANAGGETRYEHHPLDASLVADARTVLLRLPRSLAALDDAAALIAAHAHPDVVVVAGGRLKHMSLGMNDVLLKHFETLDVSHARGKSRVLTARGPRPTALPEPRTQRHDEFDLTLVATGGAFAGPTVDIGSRVLLEHLPHAPLATRAIDLGCGTGVLAARLASLQPQARVLASDQSWAAVESARQTMAVNGLDVEVTRDDALSSEPSASADLVLLNPPFHTGATVSPDLAPRLFEAAARVLRPGGALWTVYNSHLHYRPGLERLVGATRQLERTPKFTLVESIRRG